MVLDADATIRTTCPRDCYDACGIVVVRRGGRVRHVRGDPDHPVSRGRLCRKCSIGYNGVFLDPAARLHGRCAAPGRRGPASSVQVSWDEALALIAARLGALADSGEAHTILQRPLHRHVRADRLLTSRCGSSTGWARPRSTRTPICNKAGHVALDYVYGTLRGRLRPAHGARLALHPRLGREPVGVAPRTRTSTGCRGARRRRGRRSRAHADRSPRPTSTCSRSPAPTRRSPSRCCTSSPATGCSTARFIAEHVRGWDELAPLVAPCTPAWAEGATGVPAADRAGRASLRARAVAALDRPGAAAPARAAAT